MSSKTDHTCFLEIRNSEERDKYIKSANMQQVQLKEGKIKISLAMDVAERFHHKRMGYTKLSLHDKHKIPLRRIAQVQPISQR